MTQPALPKNGSRPRLPSPSSVMPPHHRNPRIPFPSLSALSAALLAALLCFAPSPALAAPPSPEPPPAVLELPFLAEVGMHLYRWFLDENDVDVDRLGDDDILVFRVRRIPVAADEGDDSEWADIRIPQFNLGVHVKRPDYAIEELGVEVRSPHFRIVHVYRLEPEDLVVPPEENWREVQADLASLLATIRQTALETRYPNPALTERLHRACRRHMDLDPDSREAGDQIIHISPMSPVANEVWVFLENENLFMQFTSDTDIESPELWPTQELRVHTIDAARNTVVSMEEMPGSNVYATRDQVGRLLYNCIVLGKRIIVVNPDDPDAPPLLRERIPTLPTD